MINEVEEDHKMDPARFKTLQDNIKRMAQYKKIKAEKALQSKLEMERKKVEQEKKEAEEKEALNRP